MGDSLGISVTDETLERATRVKRLIGRPQESAQSERKSTTRYDDETKISNKAINIDGNRHMALDLKWYSIV